MNAAGSRMLALSIDRGGARRRTALQARLGTLLSVLGASVGAGTHERLLALEAVLSGAQADRIWLALAVLTGRLPDDATVERTVRTTRLDGSLAALGSVLGRSRRAQRWPSVRVVCDQVLVDVHHLADADARGDAEEVGRRLVAAWEHTHSPLLVGWTEGRDALRLLGPTERATATGRDAPAGAAESYSGGGVDGGGYGTEEGTEEGDSGAVVVPWHCTYLLPEAGIAPWRSRPLAAMLRRSGTVGSFLGFGCAPLASAETVPGAVSGAFATMLAAAAYADRLAATSEAAAVEYRGWRAMLAGAGLTGPDITALPIADEALAPPLAEVPPGSLATRSAVLDTGGRPLVLLVAAAGEGRNAALGAADLLWREGCEFLLMCVGEGDARFDVEVARLRDEGRPVRLLGTSREQLLTTVYAAARCTVFPASIDGLALPVAASLAAGTPVVTARYGCTAEVVGGTVLVDSRDENSLADAIRSLLLDDDLHGRLTAQARARVVHTWEQYAAQLWDYLVAPA